jgi:hypothetical protein
MIITTCAALVSALKAAAAGAVLALPAGPCALPTLVNINPPGVVTITSQDAANLAVFKGDFRIANSSNLTFSQVVVDFTGTSDAYYAGRMSGVSNVTFDQVRFTAPTSQVAWPAGLYVSDSDRLAITHSRFDHIANASLLLLRATNTLVDHTDFDHWSKSAIQAGELQNFALTNSTIHDAFPIVGTHPDALQIQTAGTKAQSSGITIAGNKMWTGDGWAFQGLFIQDELDTLPILNLSVTGNDLSGTMWNALYFNGVGGQLAVKDNTAVTWTQRDIVATTDLAKPVMTPFIANLFIKMIPGAPAPIVTGNTAQGFSDANGKPVAGLPGNTLLPAYAQQPALTPAPPPVVVNPLQATVDSLTAATADLKAQLAAVQAKTTALQAQIAKAVSDLSPLP